MKMNLVLQTAFQQSDFLRWEYFKWNGVIYMSNDVKTLNFQDDGSIPNNPKFPVLIYKNGLGSKIDHAEEVFNQNNWLNSWTNGVFDYHHYHSNSHEVLGVISGSATLILGGSQGETIHVVSGDVMVLPAGTGHKRLEASEDFSVVGAYPNGIDYNTKYGKADERPGVLHDINQVGKPETDPLYGTNGPLLDLWDQNAKGFEHLS